MTAARLATRISFRGESGWTDFQIAIVDTGAPISLLPRSIWQSIDRRVLATVRVGGLADKPENRIGADLAMIRCVLSDGQSTIGPYEMTALLAHTDTAPALLGLSGVLESTDLFISLRRDDAYLEQQ